MFYQGDFINPLFGNGFGNMIFIRKCLRLKNLKVQSFRKHTGAQCLGNFIQRACSRHIRSCTHAGTRAFSCLSSLRAEAHSASPCQHIRAS